MLKLCFQIIVYMVGEFGDRFMFILNMLSHFFFYNKENVTEKYTLLNMGVANPNNLRPSVQNIGN